ncbi:CPXV205 protein, partial [Monkeypox virus]
MYSGIYPIVLLLTTNMDSDT